MLTQLELKFRVCIQNVHLRGKKKYIAVTLSGPRFSSAGNLKDGLQN